MENQFLVYRASAGSGKTFAIAAEYASRLIAEGPNAFRHILAVTFTNKATTEMKLRVLQGLEELALFPSDDCAEQRTAFQKAVAERLPRLAAAEIKSRAQSALHNILHAYDYFRIETIDSFFQTLLTSLARELHLSSALRVDIDDKQIKDQAVDRLFAELKPTSPAVGWIVRYIEGRIEEGQRWDVTEEVKRLAGWLTRERYVRQEDKLREVLESETRLKAYERNMKQLEEKALWLVRLSAQKLDDMVRAEVGDYKGLCYGNDLRNYAEKLMRGEFPTVGLRIENFKTNAEAWLKGPDKKKPHLLAMAENLRQQLLVTERQRRESEMTINSSKLSRNNINPLRLFGEVNRYIDQIMSERNTFLLARTPVLLDRLVSGDDASFVFEKSGGEFRHIMIDEFQDTSALQWSNFRKLLVENLASGGGCMLVGDVKQAIYRFRGGDWTVLQNIDSHIPHHTPTLRTLDTNFRSGKHIVTFNNRVFVKAAAVVDNKCDQEDHTTRDIYADARQKDCGRRGGQVRVEVRLVAGDKSQPSVAGAVPDELPPVEEALAKCIRKLHTDGLSYKDMAILVRYNTQGDKLLEYFTAHAADVPLVSDEVFLLSSSTAVQIVVHMLRYMADRTNTIALAYAAERYEHDVLKRDVSWHEVMTHPQLHLPAQLADGGKHLLGLPLFDICQSLIRYFQLETLKCETPFLLCFQDKLLEFLSDNASELESFLRYWNDCLRSVAIPSGETSGVRILTIHKSKGLAFHTVLIPYCDWDMEQDRRNDILWCQPSSAPYNGMPLLPILTYNGKMVRSSIYAAEYADEHRQQRTENLNLMYVAFTRPRQNLYVWAKTKIKKNADGDRDEVTNKSTTRSMGDLLYKCLMEMRNDEQVEWEETDSNVVYSLTTEAQRALPNEKETPRPSQLQFRPTPIEVAFHAQSPTRTFCPSREAQAFLHDDSEDAELDGKHDYISRGKLLHHVFSLIRTLNDVERVLREVEERGLLSGTETAASLRSLVQARLKGAEVEGWFDGSWELFNENAILFLDDKGKMQTRRPDRVMVRGRDAVAVDFKFGRQRQEHHEQVRAYCRLLQRMGMETVKGYLWYVYSGEVVPVAPI